jgi:hypothetical protein
MDSEARFHALVAAVRLRVLCAYSQSSGIAGNKLFLGLFASDLARIEFLYTCVYIAVLVANTTTYARYIITFEIT